LPLRHQPERPRQLYPSRQQPASDLTQIASLSSTVFGLSLPAPSFAASAEFSMIDSALLQAQTEEYIKGK